MTEVVEPKAKAKQAKKAKSKAKAKATKASSKNKASSKKNKVKKIPKIKIWMMENGINQKDLAERTSLSSNTINRLVNKGKATKSVIKLISLELDVSVDKLNELLKESEPIVN
jgi:DNA-binding Xre family transcriptional regulator